MLRYTERVDLWVTAEGLESLRAKRIGQGSVALPGLKSSPPDRTCHSVMPAHRESRGSRLALAAWLTAVVGASAEPAAISASVGLHAAPVEANVAEAVNAPFKDRDLDVSMGAKRFEGESREVFSARFDVLDAPGLRPGLRIADIGAGTAATSRGVEGRTWSWR